MPWVTTIGLVADGVIGPLLCTPGAPMPFATARREASSKLPSINVPGSTVAFGTYNCI